MRRRTTTMLGLVAATSLLTACGSGATDAGAPASGGSTGTTTTPTQSTTQSTTPTPSDAADVNALDFPSGTARQFGKNTGAWDLVLRDVRVSEHDGFDRVVVEFKGTGTPGWSARYVKTPRADGSGEVVDVDGDHVLEVSISGVTIRKGYPKTAEDFFHGARHFAPEHGGDIEDLNVGGVFEGYSQLFLGIDGDKAPFRVFALTNPSRLVVDVKDD
ncbi:MAG: hypothetical protein QM638_05845 [Nocardioides sp.]|uniref:AMIN-like domain-containing (lipo)protein n=1 Tax=Nocardioides sp. TaxID=35761 RepID=UPI0039E38CC8